MIGKMRERVTLQSRTITIGDIGSAAYVYNTIGQMWARVDPVSAQEKFYAERLATQGVYELTIRWRYGIDPTMRFLWRSRTFAIKQIMNPDERKQFLTIIVEDINPDAGTTEIPGLVYLSDPNDSYFAAIVGL